MNIHNNHLGSIKQYVSIFFSINKCLVGGYVMLVVCFPGLLFYEREKVGGILGSVF